MKRAIIISLILLSITLYFSIPAAANEHNICPSCQKPCAELCGQKKCPCEGQAPGSEAAKNACICLADGANRIVSSEKEEPNTEQTGEAVRTSDERKIETIEKEPSSPEDKDEGIRPICGNGAIYPLMFGITFSSLMRWRRKRKYRP